MTLSQRKTYLKTQPLIVGLSMFTLSGLLGGCGLGSSNGAGSVATVAATTPHINGIVHGGQNPVNGATIQLYTVGTGGLQSASAPLINSTTVMTGTDGGFSITMDYSCSTATQVYITATGGSSGGASNSAIALVAALGACSSLTPTTNILINELTTVAAAYALAPFAADITHIGATGSSPTGLVGAFTNAAMLVNISSGVTPGAGLSSGVTVPTTEINTLGNILAACINTTGPSSSGCNALLGATSTSNTFDAAIGMAKNPGATAVTALYSQSVAGAPFQPSMTSSTAPNDFSIAVTTTAAGGLATPFGIAVDAAGDAWVTNETGTTVTEIGLTGGVLATPTATGLAGAQAVAVDPSGNVWVANTAGNSVIKFPVTSGAVGVPSSFTTGGIMAPTSIALDGDSDAFVANFNGNSVTELSSSGAALNGSPFLASGNITVPAAIAVAPDRTVFVTSGKGSVVKLTNAGVYSATFSDGTLQGPVAVAVDTSSHVLAAGYTTGTTVGGALSEFTTAGAAASSSPAITGVSSPSSVASDGTSIWVTNGGASGGLAQFTYGAGSPVSPSAGYGSLNSPAGVAVDATGSVWVTNAGNNTVSKFIGIAAPVITPLAANVTP